MLSEAAFLLQFVAIKCCRSDRQKTFLQAIFWGKYYDFDCHGSYKGWVISKAGKI